MSDGWSFRSPPSLAMSAAVPLVLIAATTLTGAGGTASLQSTVTLLLCNLIVVVGLQIFIGNSGVYSFGQVGFAATGAYAAALLSLPTAFDLLQTPGLPDFIADAELSPLLLPLIAAFASGLIAAVVGLPLMRTSTLAIPISTFAFLVVVYNVIANWDRVTGGASGLVGIPTTTGVESAGLWAGAAVLLALVFKWSPVGYRLQATREDEVAARSLGIGLTRERMIAFVLSGALCGLGGALAVHQSGVLNPTTFYFAATVTAVTMLIVGGARSVLGAVVGAISISALTEVLRGLEDGADLLGLLSIGETPGLAAIGMGLVLLATMIALPDGLTGGKEAGELMARGLPPMRPPPLPAATAEVIAPQPRNPSDALEAQGISVSFGGLEVLCDVDLQLPRSGVLGLIGPNGAGKTTLVNVLSGFQAPGSGSIRLDGAEITAEGPERRARAGVGRTFQAALPFPYLTAFESVAIGAMGVATDMRRAERVAADVLGRLGLLDRAHLPAGSLSPALQRLLGVARALATEPRYLLLDEPAAGLDEGEREELVAILGGLREGFGCGVLVIEHDMSVVMELCPRVQVLDGGATLRVGSPEEIRSDPAVVEAYLGSSFSEAARA